MRKAFRISFLSYKNEKNLRNVENPPFKDLKIFQNEMRFNSSNSIIFSRKKFLIDEENRRNIMALH